MARDDARRFVVRMREDRLFRAQAAHAGNAEALAALLHGAGMDFDQGDLVGAMAECMSQMEQEMDARPRPK